MRTALVMATLVCAYPLVNPSPCISQQYQRELRHRASCADCQIVIRQVATIPGNHDSATLDLNSRLTRTSDGTYIATTAIPYRLDFYDASGKYLRSFGQKGGGPGEFRGIKRVHVNADTVLVEELGGRISVFSPRMEFVRSFYFPQNAFAAVLQPAGFFVQLNAPVGDRTEDLYLLRSSDGAVIRGVLSPGESGVGKRLASGFGSLWVVNMAGGYHISRYTPGGRLMGTGEFTDHWLGSSSSSFTFSRRERGRRQVVGVVAGPERLWLALHRERTGWRRNPEPASRANAGEGGVVRISFQEAERRFDRYIEAVDPRDGRLLASAKLPNMLFSGFLDGEHFVTSHEVEDGVVLRVWHFRLSRSNPARRR